MTATSVRSWTDATRAALEPLATPERASGMQAYMKDVAPFLGIPTPERRAAQRAAWSTLDPLTPGELAELTATLFSLPEREFAYAACDLIGRYQRTLEADFLSDPVEPLLLARPWWDTVDSLVTAAVCPLTRRNPPLVDLMWQWWNSGDRWLVRAAVCHQRGRKEDTDLDLLFAMCSGYAGDREFFIAKAIGWALRDVSTLFPDHVRGFVDDHPDLSPVARREALRKIDPSFPR
ncbi:MAG: DNA alkylation repair protein [Candidatus Nanopelagicales bacterium]|nr:DNA alkylation repair protein [Candidatus Nanopelagicales bacterium]MCF8537023.1 DNA alkylation repair protein [Candidatus Nanopelagicales bacterium]MCF8558086.1 DNA alkylation repair protein [Candidatus Nanopelagicales bacterium]